MLIANLFFVFYGLKPAEGTNANGYIYESGSVFLPTKYSTDYYGSSNLDTAREFYKQVNKNVANERYKNLLPMGISVFVMGVAAFVLHEDQDFQNQSLCDLSQERGKINVLRNLDWNDSVFGAFSYFLFLCGQTCRYTI